MEVCGKDAVYTVTTVVTPKPVMFVIFPVTFKCQRFLYAMTGSVEV